ncbi:hypothetical protein M2142_002457, partial [Fusobacterium sp. PH5-29]
NQTSLVGREGGTINVGNTLTNTGSIIGSLNENAPMVINAKEIVVNDLKDKDYSKNSGFGISGITADLKVPQASIQYGMSDKRQDTNSTFVNSIAYENGVKVDFEERGINTSLDNAQVITRDKEIEQIDTTLHTDMLNQSTRQQFVIDFLKTATLVPQVAKGIGQGINNKGAGQNVLGQLANNLGKNGFNIVAYAYDVDEKLKNIIEDNYINGKYGVGLDEYNMAEISGLLKPLLAEFGKDFYSIQFVEADNIKAGMSINDKEGVVYINTYGQGFGNSSEMLENLSHEGMHGTYANHLVDEIAASMLTKIPSKGWSPSIGATAITINAQGMIEASTNQYYKDRANGDLRDGLILTAAAIGALVGYLNGVYKASKVYEQNPNLSIYDMNTIAFGNAASGAINGSMIGAGGPIAAWGWYGGYVQVAEHDPLTEEVIEPIVRSHGIENEKVNDFLILAGNILARKTTIDRYSLSPDMSIPSTEDKVKKIVKRIEKMDDGTYYSPDYVLGNGVYTGNIEAADGAYWKSLLQNGGDASKGTAILSVSGVQNTTTIINNQLNSTLPALIGNSGSSVGASIGHSTSGAINGALSTSEMLSGNQLQIGQQSTVASGVGSSVTPNYDFIIEGLEDELDINLRNNMTINKLEDSNNVNDWWYKERNYTNAPYEKNTVVLDVTTNGEMNFSRVYGGKSELAGSWIMQTKDIIGLTAEEIAAKYALPTIPKYIADVKIDAGTNMRIGIVGENYGSPGGAIQIDLKGQRTGAFKEIGELPLGGPN